MQVLNASAASWSSGGSSDSESGLRPLLGLESLDAEQLVTLLETSSRMISSDNGRQVPWLESDCNQSDISSALRVVLSAILSFEMI